MSETNLTYWRGTSFYINPTARCTNNCLFCVRQFSEGVFGFNLELGADPTPEELERGRAAARQRKLEIEARLQGV